METAGEWDKRTVCAESIKDVGCSGEVLVHFQ